MTMKIPNLKVHGIYQVQCLWFTSLPREWLKKWLPLVCSQSLVSSQRCSDNARARWCWKPGFLAIIQKTTSESPPWLIQIYHLFLKFEKIMYPPKFSQLNGKRYGLFSTSYLVYCWCAEVFPRSKKRAKQQQQKAHEYSFVQPVLNLKA